MRVLRANRTAVGLDDRHFADLIHLNADGARILSEWIRRELATPGRQARASGEIVSQIERAIFDGDRRTGDRLESERELAERFSVSRITVRDALRVLEARGLVEGEWEHPERRSRRYYSLTSEGRAEYRRLVKEVRPFLDSIGRSIDEIVKEVYGA